MNTIVKIVQSVQEYSSRNTSMNKHKVPVGFKKITWKPNTINLDYGGGKYDTATEYLKDFGVENLIYDPYNRDDDFNINTLEKCQDGVDSATLMNVLNVIKEIEIQEEIINNIYMMLKDGCPLFIKIHEGDKSGEGRITLKDCWQNNKKTKDYLPIVKKVFGNHVIKKIWSNYSRETGENSMIKKVLKNWYVHVSNENELLNLIEKSFSKDEANRVYKLTHSFSKTLNCDSYIIKYASNDGSVSLIESPNWDTANEPDVGDSIKISVDGIVKNAKAKGQIYHSKECFVSSDYTGFNIQKAKERTKLWNSIPDINKHKSKIGWKKYWISLLKENNIEL